MGQEITKIWDHKMVSNACWDFLHDFLASADFFKIIFFKNSSRNTIKVSNSLEPDQARHVVRPDLGSICLQRLSADNSRCHWLGKS